MTFDGVIVAGGTGERLGGAHKPALRIGSRTLLDIAIDALADARRIIVVGPPMPTEVEVVWVREEPPGGGPVAALAAALSSCDAPETVVLAADLPFINASAIDMLRARRGTAIATIAVDGSGRDQPLLACYDLVGLRLALPVPADRASMRALTVRLESIGDIKRVDLGGRPAVSWDCDTAADLQRAREQV